ncbi:MAG TPA: FAD-dependent monooxygenase [Xanthobacteraceae bacterium]|jgi:salicylate hydroxylase|nr:FAD-dependent monooxygenase [Xanthobacteraceae bacterium]
MPDRTVIVAGAGIGGLTASLALARKGFRVVTLEQAPRLEETGAGIQLSPNAARTLIALGLGDRLRPHVVVPQELRVFSSDGRDIVRTPLGDVAAERYGAPFWVIHRGDLQAALVSAVAQELEVSLKLGMRMDDFVTHPNGVTVSAHGDNGYWDEHGDALIAADGLWSIAAERMGHKDAPRFSGRSAWRTLVPASSVAPEFREPAIHLWLGHDTHLVHYPVKGGAVINIVVITTDAWNAPGWSKPASRVELLPHLPSEYWAARARALVREPETWLKWALYERAPLPNWSRGAAALLGDAAHPMLPFLAQGAAMAIEDAAVVAHCLARKPDDMPGALRTYVAARRNRAGKVQQMAAKNGARYHFGGAMAKLRNAAMRTMGGKRLLHHYDWIYSWQPPGK